MRIVRTETGYVVRVDRGEEVLSSFARFVKQEALSGGSIVAIGAVRNAEIGCLNIRTKSYQKKILSEEMELINLTGNITWVNGEPLIHAHVTVSGSDFMALAGHLFSAEVAVTVEAFVTPTDVKLTRAFDDATGANLISDE